MKMISQVSLCAPVVNRYDLLDGMLTSIELGSVWPHVWLIHNGQNRKALDAVIAKHPTLDISLNDPAIKLGVAEAWNVFVAGTDVVRLICNDDLIFAPDSLARILDACGPGNDFVSFTEPAFSGFALSDVAVEKVGRFDETISPGYVYYEDLDYVMRMRRAGVKITKVNAGVVHLGSQTLRARTPEETEAHHKRFMLARSNFIAKWGADFVDDPNDSVCYPPKLTR